MRKSKIIVKLLKAANETNVLNKSKEIDFNKLSIEELEMFYKDNTIPYKDTYLDYFTETINVINNVEIAKLITYHAILNPNNNNEELVGDIKLCANKIKSWKFDTMKHKSYQEIYNFVQQAKTPAFKTKVNSFKSFDDNANDNLEKIENPQFDEEKNYAHIKIIVFSLLFIISISTIAMIYLCLKN